MNSGNLNSSVRVYGFSQPDLEMQQPDLELRYADLELQEPNLKLWKPDVELHDLQGVSNWDEIDAYCECGAGTFLGLIRGTPMYDNHKRIECYVYPVKPQINYLLPVYFSMLKEMELLTKDSSLRYSPKILNLIMIWKEFHLKMSNNPCSGMRVFLHFGFSESAVLVMQPKWKEVITQRKSEFIKTLKQITRTMRRQQFVDEVKMCTNFINILKDPWNHKYISCIMRIFYPSYEDMGDLLRFETSTILLHRLNYLCETDHQEIEAIKCAFLATRYYEKNLITDRNQTFFLEEDYECIRDIYYVLLLKFDLRQRLVKILKNYNPTTQGIKLIRRYYSKITYLASLPPKNRPFLHKIQVNLYEEAATVIVNNSLCSENMDEVFCKLMHHWTDIVIVLRDSDLISRFDTLTNESFFQLCIYDFIKSAISPNYLYVLYHVLYEKFGLKLPVMLYMVIITRALINYIKSKAYCTQVIVGGKLFQLSNSLVKGFFELADLFKDVLSVSRERILIDNTLNVKIESAQVLHGNGIGEVAQLSKRQPGPCAEIIGQLFSFIILLGINIVYWILMSNFLHYSVAYIYDLLFEDDHTGSFEFDTTSFICPNNASLMNDTLTPNRPLTLYQSIWDFNSILPMLLVIIVAPLLNFRSATFSAKLNSLEILSVLYLFSFVLIKSYSCGINLSSVEGSVEFFELYKNTFPATSGMLTLSLFIQNIIIAIMKNNENQKHNLLTVYPLIPYMLRVQVFGALELLMPPGLQFIPQNYLLIFMSILFAIFMPHIETVIRFSGAICGFVFICTLPTMLHLASQRKWNLLTTGSIVFHILISLIGLANLIAHLSV